MSDKPTLKNLFGLTIKNTIEPKVLKGACTQVPEIDANYHFDEQATLAILAGFTHNKRVLLQGLHGTGKSTHIEQVAARLNWPCMRINLDGHITRTDLIGKDAIVVEDGKQITTFKPGIIPWAIQQPMALVLDEYDAARADVLFVIQRLLETEGKFTLLDTNTVLTPHPDFRIFATANTVGLGDTTGAYHGTQILNQGQLDRWNIVCSLTYLNAKDEVTIVHKKVPNLAKGDVKAMVDLANLTRNAFMQDEISTVMSPRTVLSWAENETIFQDFKQSFAFSFLNRCDAEDHPRIAEMFQRCFGEEIIPTTHSEAA